MGSFVFSHVANWWPACTTTLLLLVVCARALAIDPGMAEGLLERDGHSAALTAASVFRFDDHVRLSHHTDSRPALRIFLTSGTVKEALLREVDTRALARDAQRTRVAGVLLELRPDATGTNLPATLLVLPAPPGIPLYTVYADAKVTLEQSANRVTGAVRFQARNENLSVNASFSAPLFHEEPPLEDLRGENARASAPANALLDLEECLKSRDFSGARRLVTPEMLPQILDLERRANEPEFVALFSARLPERATRRGQISQVAVYREVAYVVVNERSSSLTTLRKIKGQWRVDE